MACEKTGEGSALAGAFHEKYGLSKTRVAEDICNYSEFLKEEQKEKDKLEVLEQLELDIVY